MEGVRPEERSRFTTLAVLAAGLYTAMAGIVSLLGWAADLPRLTDWLGTGISIQPNTAVAAVAAGMALVCHALRRPRSVMGFGLAAGLIGVATLFEYGTGLDLGIDTLLNFGRTWGQGATRPAGRMGLPAASSWSLAGAALILLSARPRLGKAVAALGVAVTGVAGLSLTGYLFGADVLYALPRITAIAVQTSTTLFAVGLGLVAAVPDRQPLRTLLDPGAAGLLTRRLLPFIVGIPMALGVLHVWGERANLYDTAMGAAMLVLAVVGLLCGLLWWSAEAVRSHELAARASTVRLETSIRELEAVFRAAPVGIAVARDRECREVETNAAFAGMLGISEGLNVSLIGPDAARLPFRILDEQGRPVRPLEAPLQVAARTGQPVFGRILVVERPGLAPLTMVGAAVPVAHGAGLGGAVAVFMDVTAERRATAEREELLAAAQQARAEAETANQAKDEFLAMLSHELRSPLNSMLGWLRVLQGSGSDQALAARAVETLERNVWAQVKVINDLLDTSRIVSGKLQLEPSRVDMGAVVAGTVESMRPTAAARPLALELATLERGLEVEGDAARLQQVVGNLLHNAIKYTPAGGRVSVRLRRRDRHAEVEVEDSGEGIDGAFLPRIFDRFIQSESSTTRRHGGLGLGLAIVKHLVALHGGTVHAESDGPGRGARFRVVLPLASPAKAPEGGAAAAAASRPEPVLSGLDVLVVEDDRDSREALALALERSGARVRVAASVAQALDAYGARQPDVLVSDIGMPDDDGYALIRAIRQRERAAPRRTVAIAITGFASRQDQEAAARAGFDEHVGKPVAPNVLMERMSALMAGRE